MLQKETMKHGTKTYIALSVVATLSIISAWIVPTTELFKGIIATPVVGALIAALY